jgi:hypothetical protein
MVIDEGVQGSMENDALGLADEGQLCVDAD